MGVIIIDGRSALQFKGPIQKFESVIVALRKLQNKTDGLKIDTVPLPEKGGIIVLIQFKGPMSGFERVMKEFEILRASVAIDTVPLPEWPIPKKTKAPLRWVISPSTS
jgi:hypothetical protein